MGKTGARQDRSAVLQWVVVLGVGALIVTVVLGLNLISRLNDGQKVLNGAKPAFQTQSLKAAVAGIDFISTDVDMANPIAGPSGGGAAQIPKLVAFVSKKTGLTDAQVLAALAKNFPAATHLLEALPLSNVSAEVPKLVAFLSANLHLTDAQVLAALHKNFPALYAAITNVGTVTGGWNSISGTQSFTDFNGKPVRTVPQLRDFFKGQLIPAVAAQQSNFQSLDGTSTLTWIAPLLLIIGIVVIAFGAIMIAVNLRGDVPRGVAVGAASVVPVVGVVVVVMVLALALIPRTDNGQKLLTGLAPAFTAQSVAGDQAGIKMVAAIVDTEDPLMTPAGGGAAEVPKLIAFLSSSLHLSDAKVLTALNTNFPAITNLLEALPLSSASAEVAPLVRFLSGALKTSDAGVLAALESNFPQLTATITNLPKVTAGWNDVPGTAGLRNFSGTPIHTMVDVKNYFADDVIPVLVTQQRNYTNLVKTSNINFIGPLVLIVGLIVIAYGLLMVALARGALGVSRRPAVDEEAAVAAAAG